MTTVCPNLSFVPYIATQIGRAHLDNSDLVFTPLGTATALTIRDMESKKIWGYALGTSFTMCDKIGINLEGRWGSEKAISLVGQLRF